MPSGCAPTPPCKKANWGPYGEWFLADQQAPIAVSKVFEEIEGKLK